MSCTLPPEILDLIIDHLPYDPTILKTCCVVSKSWVPRTRKHLFALVEFDASTSQFSLWKKSFPDPSNSPAHHTRTLCVYGPHGTSAGGWIRAFHNVVNLRLSNQNPASIAPFCGLSPTIRSLHLIYTHSKVFDLICSFPLLEDLEVVALSTESGTDVWSAPLTSPRFTGTLDLKTPKTIRLVTRRLLDLPGGLRFSRIKAAFIGEDTKLVTDLVSGCSNTLEYLSLFRHPSGAFHSVPVTGQYLTNACGRRYIRDAPARPLQGHKTQISDVCTDGGQCPVDHNNAPNC